MTRKELSNYTLEEVFEMYMQWASIFTTSSYESLEGLKREVCELQEAIANFHSDEDTLFEFADCFMYLIYSLKTKGYTIPQLITAIRDKTIINENREWIKNSDGTFSHKK